MIVELVRQDLVKEAAGYTSNMYTLKDNTQTEVKELKFHGAVGFNNLASKILHLDTTMLKYFKFKLNSTAASNVAHLISIPHVKATSFIFDYLKTLGISLTELNIEWCWKDDSRSEGVMKVHNKIIKVLNMLPEDAKNDLTFYLLQVGRLLSLLTLDNKITSNLGTSVENTFYFTTEEYLETLYNNMNNLPEKAVLNVVPSDANTIYAAVMYHMENSKSVNIKFNSSSEYVYNTLSNNKDTFLIIQNKNFKEFYLLNLNSKTIYTNAILQQYNTLDFNEWIPHLMEVFFKHSKKKNIAIQYLDKVICKESIGEIEDLVMSTDAEMYSDLITDLDINISENYKADLYANTTEGIKIKTGGNVVDLAGEYENDEYAQQLYLQNKDYYNTFDLKDLTNIVRGFATGEVYSMIFIGDSGTGKSTASRVIPFKCGLPYITVNCSTNIDEADLFGALKSNDKKTSDLDPEFVWQDGLITRAVRNGYVLIIEEINLARAGILGKLNSLLDESRQIDLPNGEIVKAHKNFRVIVTCNIGYEGTNRLNKALINRFEICKQFVDLERNEAIDIIKSRTGYKDITKINAIYDVYAAIKKYSDEQSLNLIISIRQLLNIFKQGKYYKNAEDAINNTLLNAAFLEEPEHLKYFKDTILQTFKLNFKI